MKKDRANFIDLTPHPTCPDCRAIGFNKINSQLWDLWSCSGRLHALSRKDHTHYSAPIEDKVNLPTPLRYARIRYLATLSANERKELM